MMSHPASMMPGSATCFLCNFDCLSRTLPIQSTALGSHCHHRMSLAEPAMFVSVDETVSDSDVLQSPHPPRHPMKRDVSKSLVHTRSYFGKRQKKSHPGPEMSIECPHQSLAPKDYMMSRSWSNMDSPRPLLPAPLPSPALDDTGPSLEHTQRPLQVAELVNRLNFRLKRLFGNRRGSTEDGDMAIASFSRRRSGTSLNLRGPTEDANLEGSPEYLLWNGSCQLPNVSEFFETNGEVGPSSFYHTADWNAFQKTIQTQGYPGVQTRLNSYPGFNMETDLDRFDLFQGHGMQDCECETRKRKDSLFGFGDFLRSRRSSRVDKGKGRMVVQDEAAMAQQQEEATTTTLLPTGTTSPSAVISSLAEIGVLPRVSMDMLPPLSPTEPDDVPQAEFSSLESSTPSWHPASASASSSTPPGVETVETQTLATQPVTPCRIVPPPAGSTNAHAPPTLCVSSTHVSAAAPTDDSSKEKVAAPMPMTPLCVHGAWSSLLSPSVRHTKATANTNNSSQPDPTTPATPCILPTVVSPSSSSTSPSALPSPLTTMQSLSLGPPQHSVDDTSCSSCVDGNDNGESMQASSGLGLRKKSLEEKCWWDGDGSGGGSGDGDEAVRDSLVTASSRGGLNVQGQERKVRVT